MTFGEILTSGSQTLLIGVGIVFSILLVLIGFIKILTALLADKKKTPAPVLKAPAVVPTPAVVPVAVQDDENVIAVIAAAIAAIASREGTRLAVRSVRRVGQQAPAWKRAIR